MKNYLTLSIILLFGIIPTKSFSQENWEFIEDSEYCFIQSFPEKTIIPEGKKRGDYGLLVYRMHKSPNLIIQISAGFDYKSPDSVSVSIDDSKYSFYTSEDTAWSKDDKKVIYAMKRGLKFVTNGTSIKGTKVKDIYSLKGFTAAVNKLKDC